MKKISYFLLVTILFCSCGEPISLDGQENFLSADNKLGTKIGFLLSFIVLIMAIGSTNLIKGFKTLIKYRPTHIRDYLTISRTRWQMRLLWGVSIALLIFQLVWGMHHTLEKLIFVGHFAYHLFLASILYAMIVYVFPENIENSFKKERQYKLERYWSKSITKRLQILYLVLVSYMVATLPMSFIFHNESKLTDVWRDGNYLGIILKVILIILFLVVWRKKRRQLKNNFEGEVLDEEELNYSREIINNWDILVVFLSIGVHFYYIMIRTNYLY